MGMMWFIASEVFFFGAFFGSFFIANALPWLGGEGYLGATRNFSTAVSDVWPSHGPGELGGPLPPWAPGYTGMNTFCC